MKAIIKKDIKVEQPKVTSNISVNKKLDRIKSVKFTSNKTEEINKYNIVLDF